MKARELKKRYNQGQRNLCGADLSYADLSGANLHRVNLRYANLRGASLCYAALRESDLSYADLHGANFSGADLRKTDLRGANLYSANLYMAVLNFADFNNAIIDNTCLDPRNTPNGECSAFEDFDTDWKIGYRTKHSTHVGNTEYIVGEEYSAPVFSTSKTDCHPGLYVCPSIAVLKKFLDDFVEYNEEMVSVIFRPWDCHRAGEKYRVREFIIWENLGRVQFFILDNKKR